MDDPLFVRGLEGFGDLPGDRKRFLEWKRPRNEALAEVLPLDQLHDEQVTRGEEERVSSNE